MRISDWSSDVCSSDLELDDPESFLETDRGAAFVKSIVSDLYYERYERHRSDGPMPHKDANELAEAILDARREDESAHRAIASHFRFGYSPSRYWYDQGMSELEPVIDKHADELADPEEDLPPDTRA